MSSPCNGAAAMLQWQTKQYLEQLMKEGIPMAKKCPRCGRSNENAMHFCAYCSAALDSDVKLLMDLENRNKRNASRAASRYDEDEEEIIRPVRQEKEKSKAPWVILILAVAAAAVWYFFLR